MWEAAMTALRLTWFTWGVAALLLAAVSAGLARSQADEAAALADKAFKLSVAGRTSEAIPLAERALEIHEKTLPPGHPDIATSLYSLALLYSAARRYNDAEPLHKRALEIREKALPPGHRDIVASLDNLAHLYAKLGRPAESEPLQKRALEMREKALPADHPEIARGLEYLAALYRAQGRLSEAEQLSKRSLAIIEKAFPADRLLEVRIGVRIPPLEVSTKDLKRLQLDEAGAVRFRIVDPHLFVWTGGSVEQARERLMPILEIHIRRAVSDRTAAEVLDRTDAIDREIARLALADEHARAFGVAVVEVKLEWRAVDPRERLRR
jgi:tetratricopeptide (TPR) repeat protein